MEQTKRLGSLQEVCERLDAAVAALDEGDADAAKNAMIEVDDNSYAEAFGRDVTSYFTARALTDSGSWGSGRLTGHIDLFGVLRAVMAKGKEESPDFTFEKEELTVKIAVERKISIYRSSFSFSSGTAASPGAPLGSAPGASGGRFPPAGTVPSGNACPSGKAASDGCSPSAGACPAASDGAPSFSDAAFMENAGAARPFCLEELKCTL